MPQYRALPGGGNSSPYSKACRNRKYPCTELPPSALDTAVTHTSCRFALASASLQAPEPGKCRTPSFVTKAPSLTELLQRQLDSLGAVDEGLLPRSLSEARGAGWEIEGMSGVDSELLAADGCPAVA